MTARIIVLTIIAGLILAALYVANASKPIELPLVIDAQRPGVWGTYAAANRFEMIDQHACMRLMVPYRVTTERRKGVTYT